MILLKCITQTLKGLVKDMIKFYKVQGTEIRKAMEVDENGQRLEVKAVIGKVAELLEKEIIFPDNTAGNEEKWLVVCKNGLDITEFDSLQEAKDSCKERWTK